MKVGPGLVALAMVAAGACAHAPDAAPDRGSAGEETPIGELALGARPDLPAITAPPQLRAAMSARGEPRVAAALDPITHMTWRAHSYGPDVIAEAVRAHSCLVGARRCNGYPLKQTFTSRHGVAFEDFWAMLMAGYIAQLRERYGVDAEEVYISKDAGQPTLGMRGFVTDPDTQKTYGVTWHAGGFTGHGIATSRPRPPYAPDPRLGETAEMVVEILWHYYAFPALDNAQAHIRRTDADHAGKGVFFNGARRILLEHAHYATASGLVLEGAWPIVHVVPTLIVGLGSNNRFGLRNRAHLVRVTFADDGALAGSTPLVEQLTVLDAGESYPFDVSVVYGQARERAQAASRAALDTFANQASQRKQAFEAEARQFASRFAEPKHGAKLTVDDWTQPLTSFAWNDTARTLTIAIRTEQRITHAYVHYYPNPAAANFNCPDGRACAIPPAELERRFSRSYSIYSAVSVTVDATGTITDVTASVPTITPME